MRASSSCRSPPRRRRASAGLTASAAWETYATPALRAALARLVAEQPNAVLHLDSPGAGLPGWARPGTDGLFRPYIEHRVWRDVAGRRPRAQRRYVEVEWRKIELEEHACWQGADVCLAVSELDAGRCGRVAPGAWRSAPTAPTRAIRCPRHPSGKPIRRAWCSSALPPIGPTSTACWLAREVIRERERGHLTLDVVGEPPRDPVGGPGVTYHGRVDDVMPFYAAAHALVIPMFEGSGTRLKAIEAAFLGRPVISTVLGVEGLPLRPGEHYLRAETAPEWVEAIDRLRSDAAEVAAMAARARDAVTHLTWPRITAQLPARTGAWPVITRIWAGGPDGPRRSRCARWADGLG